MEVEEKLTAITAASSAEITALTAAITALDRAGNWQAAIRLKALRELKHRQAARLLAELYQTRDNLPA